MFEQKGKTALVTGATQGIGFEIAKLLSAQGAKVFINGAKSEKKCIDASGKIPNSIPVCADLTKKEEREALFKKTGGGVIWGGIRDVEQMNKIEGVQVYYRGIDPTPIRDFIMKGFNTAVRIGNAVCLPGDIVFGAGGGVLFIPSHLVAEVVDGASKTQVKDLFGFEMITQNKFTTAQIDKNTWTEEMLDLLMDFIEKDDRAEKYRGLDWTLEYDLARNGDPNDTQSAL